VGEKNGDFHAFLLCRFHRLDQFVEVSIRRYENAQGLAHVFAPCQQETGLHPGKAL
jgi:hypothetical protein